MRPNSSFEMLILCVHTWMVNLSKGFHLYCYSFQAVNPQNNNFSVRVWVEGLQTVNPQMIPSQLESWLQKPFGTSVRWFSLLPIPPSSFSSSLTFKSCTSFEPIVWSKGFEGFGVKLHVLKWGSMSGFKMFQSVSKCTKFGEHMLQKQKWGWINASEWGIQILGLAWIQLSEYSGANFQFQLLILEI